MATNKRQIKLNNNESRELSLGNDFGPAVVHVNGASISVDEKSNVVVVTKGNIDAHTTQGSITAYSDKPVQLKAPVPEQTNAIAVQEKSGAKRGLEVGDKMEDGTIFAGVSPDTGANMFVTPQDAPGTLQWKAAMNYAADLDANGHKDWKLPTKAELDVLYQNRDKGALKSTFDESGSSIAGWYWSSTAHGYDSGWASMQRFSDGNRNWGEKGYEASVRPVRSEPRPAG